MIMWMMFLNDALNDVFCWLNNDANDDANDDFDQR
jgi:hypothetical protein